MQAILPITQITGRAKRVGYCIKDLAAAAGVNEATLYRASNSRIDTLQRLGAALMARELELRDYLIGLHPLAAERQPEAAE